MYNLESNPEMTDMDILGGLFPILEGEVSKNGNEFRTKPGFLTRHLVSADRKDIAGEKKLLVLHNIDALPERVRAALAQAPCVLADQNLTIPVTLSFGVAVSLEDADSADGLLAAADKRLYDAKNGGRDRVCVEG